MRSDATLILSTGTIYSENCQISVISNLFYSILTSLILIDLVNLQFPVVSLFMVSVILNNNVQVFEMNNKRTSFSVFI